MVLEFCFNGWYEREAGNQESPEVGRLVRRLSPSSAQRGSLPCPETVKVVKAHASAEEKFPCPCLSEWLGLK